MEPSLFLALIQEWFTSRLGEPTPPQRAGWPLIAERKNTLIAAPTGSGKTLAAFLVCIDQLARQWYSGDLTDDIQVVYVSPLKALSNDIHRNLETPLKEICKLAEARGIAPPPIRTAVRTGDTPQSQRQAMLRRPPHILVTTPESLYLLLTSEKARDRLRTVRTVIVDEIHALARDKRGSHLSLSLERLESLCEQKPLRIGLSATQRPINRLAEFLVGSRYRSDGSPDCSIVDIGHVRELDLAVEVPPSELSAVCSHEQWGEVYASLARYIAEHRSTLIFVNTRKLAERVALHLRETLGDEAVASHHGSLSRKIRHSVEAKLKAGELKAIVATASLEMGIDVGFIDLVCQIGSPRSIATFLQRVGRSGHSLGVVPKGRLFPLTREELIECLALQRAVIRGDLDAVEIPQKPLDILAQQIVAAVACDDYEEDDLFALVRRAWPYRDLERSEFDRVLEILSRGIVPGNPRGRHLHRDVISRRVRPRRGARIAAVTCGGAIPELNEYRVVVEPEAVTVGALDEEFAFESSAGDIFILGNNSWRVRHVRGSEVVVEDAQGAPATIPFWFGEAPARTVELSHEVSKLREAIIERWRDNGQSGATQSPRARFASTARWLGEQCATEGWAAEQAVSYVTQQFEAIGLVPTTKDIVFERFFDASGGMQLVIHAPLGARINRAWGFALRKRFCRSFDFELQAAADDNGILLSLSPQHSFPVDALFGMLNPGNAEHLLTQAVLAAPMFQTRWRWNVTRALAVLRNSGGKRVPPHLQRFRSDDLLAATFPETVGCLENHHGDVEIPDHPYVQQTMHDCLTEAMDLPRWKALLKDVQAEKVRLIARDTREPSPFCDPLLNANPYAFLDDAPLEERRTRAMAGRRAPATGAMRDLTRLDEQAIDQVCGEAWPVVRSPDELHDALLSLVLVSERELEPWQAHCETLAAEGRAAAVRRPGQPTFWVAAENGPLIEAAFPEATTEPAIQLPEALRRNVQRAEAWVEIARGRLQHCGPVVASEVGATFGIEPSAISAAFESLEGSGLAVRGQFRLSRRDDETQWCDRRLLARIHRLTLDGLRRQIKPVEPEDFIRFLVRHHRIFGSRRRGGLAGLRAIIEQLQGFQSPAAAWEQSIFRARLGEYRREWLDQLTMSGEVAWGRIRPPVRNENGASLGNLTRAVPIALMTRSALPWMLPTASDVENRPLPERSQQLLQFLLQRGALFFQELADLAELNPVATEEALRELAAAGLVTADGFSAIRQVTSSARRRQSRWRSGTASRMHTGRWSLFPGVVRPADEETRIESWCRQLLARYGVLFRDLLTREVAAPPWRYLVRELRRMELRGEVRGGRFVSGVAGEQYATPEAVQSLREVRDEPGNDPSLVLSAADPLNLIGIVTGGRRLPAIHTGVLVLRNGRCIATRKAGRIQFFEKVSTDDEHEIVTALSRGAPSRRSAAKPQMSLSGDVAGQ